MENLKKYMQLCEELARLASKNGNTGLGSVLVLNNRVLAEAQEATTTKQDVSCHAEMEVIRKARKILGKDMSGAILISNKEPCVMCAYAIRYHRISKVVYKEKSGLLGGIHGPFNLLNSENVPTDWGPVLKYIEYESGSDIKSE